MALPETHPGLSCAPMSASTEQTGAGLFTFHVDQEGGDVHFCFNPGGEIQLQEIAQCEGRGGAEVPLAVKRPYSRQILQCRLRRASRRIFHKCSIPQSSHPTTSR